MLTCDGLDTMWKVTVTYSLNQTAVSLQSKSQQGQGQINHSCLEFLCLEPIHCQLLLKSWILFVYTMDNSILIYTVHDVIMYDTIVLHILRTQFLCKLPDRVLIRSICTYSSVSFVQHLLLLNFFLEMFNQQVQLNYDILKSYIYLPHDDTIRSLTLRPIKKLCF